MYQLTSTYIRLTERYSARLRDESYTTMTLQKYVSRGVVRSWLCPLWNFIISHFPLSFFFKLTIILHLSKVIPYSFLYLCLFQSSYLISELFYLPLTFVLNKGNIFLRIPYSYSNSMFLFLCWNPTVEHSKFRILPLWLRYRLFSLSMVNSLVLPVSCPLDYLRIHDIQ